MTRRLPILTQSSLAAMASCEEKFRLRYLERMTTRDERPHFGLGSAFHKGVELGSVEAAVEFLRTARGPSWSPQEADSRIEEEGVLRGMVGGALARWSDWPETREQEFRVPLVNPESGRASTAHLLAGKIDGVWETGDRLLELKTSSRLDQDYIRHLDIDFQITSYLACASMALGRKFREVVYRIARKPSIKRTQKESASDYAARVEADYHARPEFYFCEALVTRTDADLDRWRAEVWVSHLRIMALENGGMTVRNTRACLDFGRCDYFDLCTGAVNPDSYRTLDNPHPELENAQ